MAYVADLRNDFVKMRVDFELVGKHLSNAQTKYIDSEKRFDKFDGKLERAAEQEASMRMRPRHSWKPWTPPDVYSPSGARRPALYSGVETTTEGVRELIVIGGGPAGYTAALYAARGEPAPARHRGHPVGRPAHDHERRRELPGLSRGDPRAGR